MKQLTSLFTRIDGQVKQVNLAKVERNNELKHAEYLDAVDMKKQRVSEWGTVLKTLNYKRSLN
jgi:hypothetical protein